MAAVLIKGGILHTDAHREKPCEDEGEAWGDASPSRGTAQMASKAPAAGAMGNPTH